MNKKQKSGGLEQTTKLLFVLLICFGVCCLCISLSLTQIAADISETAQLQAMVLILMLALLFAVFAVIVFRQRSTLRSMKNVIYYNTETGLSTMEGCKAGYESLKSGGKGYTMAALRSNDFVVLNNMLGYEVVDKLIIEIAEIILKNLDVKKEFAMKSPGRAEFFLLIKSTGSEAVERIENIVAEINRMPITNGEITYVFKNEFISVSYELTGTERDFAQIINNTEIKVLSVFDGDKESDASFADLVYDIPDAFEKNQFEPMFEIRKNLQTDEIVGADLKVCWHHPEKGIIKEHDFMHLLELKNCSLKLELYMVEQACKLIRKWIDRKMMPLPVTVTIVRGDIYNSDFLQHLIGMVNKYGVSPGLIELSILTPSNLQFHPRFTARICELKEKGFLISLPDFYAVGYSSMLFSAPYDSLCVDLDDFGGEQRETIGNNIVVFAKSIAQKLGCIVYVKGVTDEATAQFLKEHNIFYAQGSLIAQEMTLKEYEKHIFDELDLGGDDNSDAAEISSDGSNASVSANASANASADGIDDGIDNKVAENADDEVIEEVSDSHGE